MLSSILVERYLNVRTDYTNTEELRLWYPRDADFGEETSLATPGSVTGPRITLHITPGLTKSPGVTVCGFISFENVDPMLMKNSLNLLQITVFSLVKKWSLSWNLYLYFYMVSIYDICDDGTYRWIWIFYLYFLWFLFMIFFMFDHIYIYMYVYIYPSSYMT